MQRRRRFKQTLSLDERLTEEVNRLRQEAEKLPSGPERDELHKTARQAENASRMNGWLTSPGLQPSK